VSVFSRFHPRLQEAIVARVGWSSLRPVQEAAGEALLDGLNAVVLAPTAGGKTEAAFFPTLSGLMADEPEGVGAVYVAPIKALLNNQADRLGLYTEMVGLHHFVWHGDTADHARRRFLSEPTALLMTTPESLEVMLISRRVDAGALFGELRVIIVDEIHAVAGTDRGGHLMSVTERLAEISRHDIQRVGLSATVGNPDAILAWLQGTSEREGRVVDPPRQPSPKELLVIHRGELGDLARDAARVAHGNKSLFFCQSRSTTEAVAEHMRRAGTTVFVHHSAVSREERELAEARFNQGDDASIVCTSTLELGIDVGDLDLVLQAEAPDTVSSFLQRMGRTGRRPGQTANTTFFCETTEGVLQAVALIELAKSGWVEDVKINKRCWPVLIHQLLVLALAPEGTTVDTAWEHLVRVPDLHGVNREEYDRLIAWMIQDQSLLLVGGQLALGPKAERLFGRRNFMEMYAVFTSPQSYAVQTQKGNPLGSLNQAFADQLAENVSCFLLGGRPWLVAQISHDERRIIVVPAPRGRRPTWGGYLPRFLGCALCCKILDIVTTGQTYPYLDAESANTLSEHQAAMAPILEPAKGGIAITDDGIDWWTYAGGRINSTIRHALLAINRDWTVTPDNFTIKIRGDGLSQTIFQDALRHLRGPDIWDDEAIWSKIAHSLPAYRLTKFQPVMPPWVEQEVIARYLLDVESTRNWLCQPHCC
jgi:ATP-dependent Lhr-like helicase